MLRVWAWLKSRRAARSEFNRVVHDTVPPMTDAELDRYRRYHTSNQHGR